MDAVIQKAAAIKPGIEKRFGFFLIPFCTIGFSLYILILIIFRELGPIIDEQSLNRIKSYIDDSEKDGHKVLLDGRKWMEQYGKTNGNWMGPTVILFNDIKHKGITDEIFGPVLSVYICKSKEEAIQIENGNPYGNAACIYTSTGENALWFQKRFSAGMIGVNVGVPVPREPFAFGGINLSKFGDSDS